MRKTANEATANVDIARQRTKAAPPNKRHYPHIDILNIIAIVAVLLMHHNATVFNYGTDFRWQSALAIKSIFYFAVPLFIMLSGATLLNYHEKYDTKTYFRKRALKVLIPAAIWIIGVFIWKVAIGDMALPDWSLNSIINALLQNRAESTYYYLFVVLGLYITIPVFAPLAKKKHRKILWYAIVAYAVINSFIPEALSYLNIIANTDFRFKIDGYVVLLFLGYLLNTAKLCKKKRIMLYFAGIAATVYHFVATLIASRDLGDVSSIATSYTSYRVMLQASAVFVFIKSLRLKENIKRDKALAMLSSCSFGIYLVHMIVMYYERSLILAPLGKNGGWWAFRFFFPFVTYLLCVLLILLLKKLPIIRRAVP